MTTSLGVRRLDTTATLEVQLADLNRRLIGQGGALERILPYVQMYQAGLGPEGRPQGVFLLLGPTGTGKTKTVEVLAEALHGSERSLLRVDCGEFQADHEVAKLIGAPPGYLGHRETQPMLTQQKLNSVVSEHSSLSLVLFDEIEKGASSLQRLLLGVLDRGTLKLGDGAMVNFERSLIFMTSNLGARQMEEALTPSFGFSQATGTASSEGEMGRIGLGAVRRKFSPEFVNRIDEVVTYRPLTTEGLREILAQQLDGLQRHITRRLGPRSFRLSVAKEAGEWLLREGTSAKWGARELKRLVLRKITQPLAGLVAKEAVEPGGRVRVVEAGGGLELVVEKFDTARGEVG